MMTHKKCLGTKQLKKMTLQYNCAWCKVELETKASGLKEGERLGCYVCGNKTRLTFVNKIMKFVKERDYKPPRV